MATRSLRTSLRFASEGQPVLGLGSSDLYLAGIYASMHQCINHHVVAACDGSPGEQKEVMGIWYD
jgi:hypothetical protein